MEKTFSGQILCSCAFGANVRSYTKQRARHGTPFLQPPPPPPSAGVHVTPPPPPPAEQFSGCPMNWHRVVQGLGRRKAKGSYRGLQRCPIRSDGTIQQSGEIHGNAATQRSAWHWAIIRAGRKLLCGGGGWHGSPFAQPPPPPPWSPCREGFGLGLPFLPCRGGGGGPTPTYMAQNDPHVALIILTTHMWGKIFE